jgi:hypothetical protein
MSLLAAWWFVSPGSINGKDLHRNALISTKYLLPAAAADLIVHCTGQGYEIKKRKLCIYCGVF